MIWTGEPAQDCICEAFDTIIWGVEYVCPFLLLSDKSLTLVDICAWPWISSSCLPNPLLKLLHIAFI